jgi:prepilin-type N-terminal cleavage/methylation domain-containing protein
LTMTKQKRNGGFTLLEVLLVIVVASILLTIAAPSFANFIKKQQVEAAATQLQSAVALARSAAIQQRKPVFIKPIVGGDFSNGWLVTTKDTDTYASCTECLTVHQLDDTSVYSSGMTGSHIEFTKDARLDAAETVHFCQTAGAAGINVAIELSGYVTKASTTSCGS